MSAGAAKNQIAAKLDEQNLHDLQTAMCTAEGRRFFAWLLMKCGHNKPSFTGDEAGTYFNEGMRNAALLLESCMRAMGLPGIDLMHQAQREYVLFQKDLEEQIKCGKGEK